MSWCTNEEIFLLQKKGVSEERSDYIFPAILNTFGVDIGGCFRCSAVTTLTSKIIK